MLLIGTDDGVYRAAEIPFEPGDVDRVLDCGKVTSLSRFDGLPGVFVSAADGIFRSTDGGDTWSDLRGPSGDRYWYESDSAFWSILVATDGTLYAGTNDPCLYRSTDVGETWSEIRGFRRLPSRGVWESPRDPHRARVRALEQVPGRPEHLLVGVEGGGIHETRDAGATWIDRRETSPTDDIHQIVPFDEDVWLVPTGYLDLSLEHLGMGHAVGLGGLHRTTDGGETWRRLDRGNEYAYIHRCFVHDGTVFFCGATEAPPAWRAGDHETALFESTDFGRTFDRVSYPGEPHEVIEDWTVVDGMVMCGAGLFISGDPPGDVKGRVMRRTDAGEYETVGTIPHNIGRLAAAWE